MAIKMTNAEWLALAGLLRTMIGADGRLTLQEHRFVGRLANRLGSELWTSLAKAERELPTQDDVREQAAEVLRPEVRTLMREILEELAASDGIVAEEQALLDWLDETWSQPQS